MGRKRPLFTGFDRLAVATMASPWLIGLAAFSLQALADRMPHTDPAHPDNVTTFHAWMEFLSFLGTFGLFVSALVAGWITFSQLRDARAARVAAIYMEVNKTYTAEPMRQARLEILKLKREFEAGGGDGDLALYVADHMLRWKTTPIDGAEFAKFNTCSRILQFWEDVGVLVGWDFVDPEVILDFHRAALRAAYGQFHIYIERARRADETSQSLTEPAYQTRLYDNALSLMTAAFK